MDQRVGAGGWCGTGHAENVDRLGSVGDGRGAGDVDLGAGQTRANRRADGGDDIGGGDVQIGRPADGPRSADGQRRVGRGVVGEVCARGHGDTRRVAGAAQCIGTAGGERTGVDHRNPGRRFVARKHEIACRDDRRPAVGVVGREQQHAAAVLGQTGRAGDGRRYVQVDARIAVVIDVEIAGEVRGDAGVLVDAGVVLREVGRAQGKVAGDRRCVVVGCAIEGERAAERERG